MKSKTILAFVSLLLLLTSVSCSSSSVPPATAPKGGVQQETTNRTSSKQADDQLTTEQKVQDFEYLYKIVKENYPFLKVNQRVNGIDWLANKEKYRKRIEGTKNDRSFQSALRFILRELNNGHADVLSASEYADDKQLYSDLDKLNVNSQPWMDALNQEKSKARYGTYLSALTPPATSQEDKSQRQSSEAHVSPAIFEKDKVKVGYLKIPTLDHFQIEPDMEVIKPFLQRIRNCNALMIDIRGNSGGDSTYWSQYVVPMLIDQPIHYLTYTLYRGGSYSIPFIEARMQRKFSDLAPIAAISSENLPSLPPEAMTDFQRYRKVQSTITPKDPVRFKGKIYLVVDQGTASSSEMWAVFAEQTGWATLVGSKTGGDGIGIDPILVSLPNSGFIFKMSIDLGLKADGSIDDEVRVTPSILVETDPGAPRQPYAGDLRCRPC